MQICKSVPCVPMLDPGWSRYLPVAITRHGQDRPLRRRSALALRSLQFLTYLTLTLTISLPAHSQRVAHLRCQGLLFGAPAVIDGIREYAPFNALGDGPVRFAGTVATAGLIGEMHCAGYTATAPFEGVMSGPLGAMRIGVLDNTAGRMIIYNGRAALGPPDTIGQFTCAWG